MSDQKKATSNLALQGGILAAASLIVRLIGFFYRIPLVNLLKEEGMGYYSSAFEIYSYLLVISSYALPAALSKIISNKITLKRYKQAHQIFRAGLLLGLLIGVVTSSILYFQAHTIAKLIGSEGSVYALRALAPSLLIFSLLAVFRGYFQGHNTMVPTAMSQIIEQIVNAICSLSLAYILLKQSLAYGAAGGTLGTAFGALFGLLFLVFIYSIVRPKFKKRVKNDQSKSQDIQVFTGWQIILMTSVPMLIGSSIYNLSNLVDMVMFQRGLLYHGYEKGFVSAQYGLLSSKYRLILTLPISIATALATASIPSITASLAAKAYQDVKKKALLAIKIVLIISVPSAFGLGVLAKPILIMLFGSTNIDIASRLMQIGAVSIVFFSLSSISIGILQGINKVKIPVKHSLIGVVLKIIVLAIFLYVFDFGLIGAVVANVLFSLFVAFTNFYSIQKEIKLKIDYKVFMLYPILSGLMMSLVAVTVHFGVMALVEGRFANTLATLLAILVAIPVYFISLIKLGGLEEGDLRSLPMGSKLVVLAKKMKWMA